MLCARSVAQPRRQALLDLIRRLVGVLAPQALAHEIDAGFEQVERGEQLLAQRIS